MSTARYQGSSGQTVYLVLWNQSDQVWNQSTSAWETYNYENWTAAAYCILASEIGSPNGTGRYTAATPSSLTAGWYTLDWRVQAESAPATTDDAVAKLSYFDGANWWPSYTNDPLANTVPGSYASGMAGFALGHIGSAQIITTNIVAQGGNFAVIQGDTYYAADGRAIQWTDATGIWPNLTGATLTITVYGPTAWTHAVEIVTQGVTYQTIQLELSATDTAAIPSGRFKVTATLASGHTATLVDSFCTSSPV